MFPKCCPPAAVDQLDSSQLIWDRIGTHLVKQLLENCDANCVHQRHGHDNSTRPGASFGISSLDQFWGLEEIFAFIGLLGSFEDDKIWLLIGAVARILVDWSACSVAYVTSNAQSGQQLLAAGRRRTNSKRYFLCSSQPLSPKSTAEFYLWFFFECRYQHTVGVYKEAEYSFLPQNSTHFSDTNRGVELDVLRVPAFKKGANVFWWSRGKVLLMPAKFVRSTYNSVCTIIFMSLYFWMIAVTVEIA